QPAQGELHAVAQQTWSMQLPDAHSASTAHGTPASLCGRQVSVTLLQYSPASHFEPSGGQAGVTPSHFSARSHTPDDGRQTVVAGCTTSAGQAPASPAQRSSTSQPPGTAGRQTTALPRNVSGGQSTLSPGQTSSTSQGPPASRQVT